VQRPADHPGEPGQLQEPVARTPSRAAARPRPSAPPVALAPNGRRARRPPASGVGVSVSKPSPPAGSPGRALRWEPAVKRVGYLGIGVVLRRRRRLSRPQVGSPRGRTVSDGPRFPVVGSLAGLVRPGNRDLDGRAPRRFPARRGCRVARLPTVRSRSRASRSHRPQPLRTPLQHDVSSHSPCSRPCHVPRLLAHPGPSPGLERVNTHAMLGVERASRRGRESCRDRVRRGSPPGPSAARTSRRTSANNSRRPQVATRPVRPLARVGAQHGQRPARSWRRSAGA
jgi:hypothetical protein